MCVRVYVCVLLASGEDWLPRLEHHSSAGAGGPEQTQITTVIFIFYFLFFIQRSAFSCSLFLFLVRARLGLECFHRLL